MIGARLRMCGNGGAVITIATLPAGTGGIMIMTGTHVMDKFEIPDGSLGGSWVTAGGFYSPTISAGRAVGGGNDLYAAYYSGTENMGADQWSQIVYDPASDGGGPAVRIIPGATRKLYYADVHSTAITVKRVDGAITTQLTSVGGFTLKKGDVVRLSVIATTLNVYVNGILKVTTGDSRHVTGGIGFCLGTNNSIDNWEGGTANDTQIGTTLTSVGQKITIPTGTNIYAQTSQAETWNSNFSSGYWNGYRLSMTGAEDGSQSSDNAQIRYFSGNTVSSGSVVCVTGNVVAAGHLSLGLYLDSGP